MTEKNKLLTIGQFAAMHGINKKTLMWYDEIGLLKPAAINPENGYRCYNYYQSPLLETILLLRELDVSIREIQDFMKDRSAEKMKCLLEEKIADLDRSIKHLYAVRKTLCNYHQNMETLLTMDLSEITILEKAERCLVTVDITPDTTFEEEVEMITAETEKYHLGRLHDASYGSMIPVKSLQSGRFDDYCKLFIEIPFDNSDAPHETTQKNGLHIQPGGNYLRAFHQGGWDQLPQRYQEILNYAQRHHLTLGSFSYEMGMNENVIDCIEDYIVQIEIPIYPSAPI
ncbi:MAG: MerR family transcriptional regulator [Lachnospiraceae bacterium]|nr:MerR family transcriptional regulator [Lachnospiraceae bacterium]